MPDTPQPPVSDIQERLGVLLPYVSSEDGPVAYDYAPNTISPGAGVTWVPLAGNDRKDFDWGGRCGIIGLNDAGQQYGQYLSIRQFKIIFAAGALGSGGPGDLPKMCDGPLNNFAGFFLARQMLSYPPLGLTKLPNIVLTTPGDDTGVTSVEYAGTIYVGVVFDLEIQRLVPYVVEDGE